MGKLVLELVFFGFLAFFFLGTGWLEMPNARDKRTGRRRTLRSRWLLASTRLRGQLIIGVAAGFVALLATLQLLSIVPSP